MDAVLEKLLEIERVERGRRVQPDGEEHPFFAWKPRCAPWHPKGNVTFQRDILTCKAHMMGAISANRAGKTALGCRLVAARLVGYDPLFPEKEFAPDQNIWAVAEPKLTEKLFKRIISMIPQRYWVGNPRWSKGEQGINTVNGTLLMKSSGMPREEFQMDSVSLLWADEEPPQHIWDECMTRLDRPDSQVFLSFTPVNGTQFMWDEFDGFSEDHMGMMEGEKSWFTSKMEDNDTLTPEYIARQKHRYRNDPDMYAIRIEGKYINMRGRQIFSEVISRMREQAKDPVERIRFNSEGKATPTKMDSDVWIVWKRPEPSHMYVIAADLAEGGLEGDFTAAFVIDTDMSEVVARFHGKVEPGPFGRDLAYCGRWYNTATINWEMNMQGAAVMDRLRDIQYPRLALRQSMGGRVKTQLQTYGFRTDRHSKPTIIGNLRDALGDEVLYVPDLETIDELSHFGYLRKEHSSAGTMGMGALSGHDDLVMALAIAWHTAKKNSVVGRAPEPPKNFGDELEAQATQEATRATKSKRYQYDGL